MPGAVTRPCRWASIALLVTLCAGCTVVRDRGDYAGLAARLKADGLLRTERAPADVPCTPADLVRDFRDIALSYEFTFDRDRMVVRPRAKPLQRWRGTVRYGLIGDAVTAGDVAQVDALMAELAGLTGLRFVRTRELPDMLISIASAEGRGEVSRYLAAHAPPADRERYEIWRRSPGWICGATLASAARAPDVLTNAHVFLPAEATGIMRRSCLQEEITQSLGLTNDSTRARPSIFNDDQEFVDLTEHDAILLRTLYDPRLRPGMQAAEAMPVVERIIAELAGDRPAAGTPRTAGARAPRRRPGPRALIPRPDGGRRARCAAR